MKIKIKYFKGATAIKKISVGDWIDLSSRKTIYLKKGDFALIPLGVAMKLPYNCEAYIVPRSSTFKNFGIIQTNSVGIIDNSYSGNEDEWMMPVYATKDTIIFQGDRICQFRIQKRMNSFGFEQVESLSDNNRGGFGSTGV